MWPCCQFTESGIYLVRIGSYTTFTVSYVEQNKVRKDFLFDKQNIYIEQLIYVEACFVARDGFQSTWKLCGL